MNITGPGGETALSQALQRAEAAEARMRSFDDVAALAAEVMDENDNLRARCATLEAAFQQLSGDFHRGAELSSVRIKAWGVDYFDQRRLIETMAESELRAQMLYAENCVAALTPTQERIRELSTPEARSAMADCKTDEG